MPANVTLNRSYQLPHGLNYLDEDVLRLIAAFDAIDVDMDLSLTGLADKSELGHTHSIAEVIGLTAALAGKMDASETFVLDDLTDVNIAGATTGQFLRFVTGEWISVTFDASFIASGTVAEARLPANLAAAALNAAYAAIGHNHSGVYAPVSHSHAQSEITSLVADLALKAPLADPAFTGNPTAPTQSPGNNTTRLATTAFVKAAIDVVLGGVAAAFDTLAEIATELAVLAASIKAVTENAQTGTTYTLVLTDAGKMVTLNNASGITLTIPTNASVAFPLNTRIDLLQYGAGQVTVSPTGITLVSSGTKRKLTGQYSGATLWKKATDTWVLIGDIAV